MGAFLWVSTPTLLYLDEATSVFDADILHTQARDGTNESFTTTSASTTSTNSHFPVISKLPQFTVDGLLRLSDSVRRSISEHGNFGPDIDQLEDFLFKAMWNETSHPFKVIDLEMIKEARLDKLLAEIIECWTKDTTLSAQAHMCATRASGLQKLWRMRLLGKCF